MEKRLCLCVAWLALSCLVGACGEPGGSGPPVDGEMALRRGNGGDPGSLDPALAEDTHAFRVLRDLYEGLVTEDASGALVAGAASGWSVSDDRLQYRFELRPDARWSNGEPLAAADFVQSLRRALTPQTGSSYAFLLLPIRNARQVLDGSMPPEALGVRELGPNRLEIELEEPTPYFPGILAMPVAYPVFDAAGAGARRWSDPREFVGNGPYVLQHWEPGSRIRLVRNPLYRGSEPATIPAVEYYAIADPATELSMYRAGELHITATVPTGDMASLRRDRPDELRVSPSLGLYYLAFDLSGPPFDSLPLRRALNLAIDRQRLADIIGRGEAPAFGIVPDGVQGYDAARFPWQQAPDAERQQLARSMLQVAGYGAGEPLEITLLYDAGDIHETVALAVGAMWQDVLGIEVAYDKREWQYFLDTRDARDEWQVMRFAWFGDYNDATTFLDIFRSDSPQNLPAYRDADYDQLLDSAAAAADPEARARLLHRAETVLLDEVPVIPLYFYVSKHLVSPSVGGFRPNVLDVHPTRHLEFVAPP